MTDIDSKTQTTKAARDEPPSTEPSRQLPTRELLEKVHKSELQKRCREMGLTKVWVNKDQLSDMTLYKSQSATAHDVPQHETSPPAAAQTPHPDVHQPLHPYATQPLQTDGIQPPDTPPPYIGAIQPLQPGTTEQLRPSATHLLQPCTLHPVIPR